MVMSLPTSQQEYNHGAVTGFPVAVSNYSPYQPQPQQPPLPHLRTNHLDWSTGLFGCFSNFSNCCITCWCPCITFGQVAEIVDNGSTSCGASGALYTMICVLIGCGWIYSCFYRTKMRRQYMLRESPCCDCLVHFCCEPCALCQEYRELENRGFDMVLGWQGNIEQGRHRGLAMTPTAPAVESMHR